MKKFKVIPVRRIEIDMKNRFSEPAFISSLPWPTKVHFTLQEMISQEEGITLPPRHKNITQ
jgi:hypothetical protein